MPHGRAVQPETLTIIKAVHDTVRDTVSTGVGSDSSTMLTITGIVVGALVAAIFGLPALWQWIENGLGPEVTVRLDLSWDAMVALDRHAPWSGTSTERYAVIKVRNRRGLPFPIIARFESPQVKYPIEVVERVLGPKRTTYYYFPMQQVGDPQHASIALRSPDWERTYLLSA